MKRHPELRADETEPDGNATLFDVMKEATEQGRVVISDGRRTLVASRVRPGFHRVGGVIRNFMGKTPN